MNGHMTPEQIEMIRELSAKGVPVSEIARQVGVAERSVIRRRTRMGLSIAPSHHMDAETRERVMRLRADGVPGRWIAEDVGFYEGTIYKIAPTGEDEAREWRRVWGEIKRKPTLAALHREFAPS